MKGAVIGAIVAVSIVTFMTVGIVLAIVMAGGAADPVGQTSAISAVELGDYARTTKPVYGRGEPVVVQFYNTPGNHSDWIALCRKDQGDGEYITYQYTKGQRNGELTFTDKALEAGGDFEIRVYFDGGYDLRGVTSFSVDATVARPTSFISLDRIEYGKRETVAVQFHNVPSGQSAWIALAKKGSGDNTYVTYKYTGDSTDGQVLLDGVKKGQYEVRLYLDSGYTVTQRIPFSVK